MGVNDFIADLTKAKENNDELFIQIYSKEYDLEVTLFDYDVIVLNNTIHIYSEDLNGFSVKIFTDLDVFVCLDDSIKLYEFNYGYSKIKIFFY